MHLSAKCVAAGARGHRTGQMAILLAVAFCVLRPCALVGQARTASEQMGRVERPQAGAHPDSLGALSLEQLMEHFGVPGVSVAVIWDFQIHWAKGYGIADVETGAPVTPETLFQAGSISKPVAAMAVLRAVEDGLFGLDDDRSILARSPATRRGLGTDSAIRATTPTGRSQRSCSPSRATSCRILDPCFGSGRR
jgi:CubicO group peptidase (beta-lactamase class C family)